MSVIAVNNSLVDYQARTKGNARHIRNYQRVSETNLDEASIVAFLRSRNLKKTLSTFLNQSNLMKNGNPILDIFLRGGRNYEGSVVEYWQMIEKAIAKRSQTLSSQELESRKAKAIKLELFIYIWYCISESELNTERVALLKQFITAKGEILSENPELLAYFALPYVDKNIKHPILKQIYSLEWKQEVKCLLQEMIGGEEVETMEQEWLNIIKDMIEICEQLVTNIKIEASISHIKDMVERVKLYKSVVQRNQMDHMHQLQNEKEVATQQNSVPTNLSDVKSLRNTLSKLNEEAIQKTSSQASPALLKIYHRIQLEIAERYQSNTDKGYISQLVAHDILLLKLRNGTLCKQYHWLKLLQIMSSYYRCRTYLLQNKQVVNKIVEVAFENYADDNRPFRLETLYLCFDVLQKLLIRRQLFEEVLKNERILTIAIALIQKYQSTFEKQRETFMLFEVVLSWVVNTVIHRKGRERLAKSKIFETLVLVLNRLSNMENSLLIEASICSSIYLLLVEQSIRIVARRVNLKQVVLNRMMEKKNDSFDSIVKYIIERLENDGGEVEEDSDEDKEREEEFDENIDLSEEEVPSKGRGPLKEGKANEGSKGFAEQKSHGREEYMRDRYSWKKKWLKK